jgi:hypothetical protein
VSEKCSPFCNHIATDRYAAQLALAAPPGMSVYELNLGQRKDPCQVNTCFKNVFFYLLSCTFWSLSFSLWFALAPFPGMIVYELNLRQRKVPCQVTKQPFRTVCEILKHCL